METTVFPRRTKSFLLVKLEVSATGTKSFSRWNSRIGLITGVIRAVVGAEESFRVCSGIGTSGMPEINLWILNNISIFAS